MRRSAGPRRRTPEGRNQHEVVTGGQTQPVSPYARTLAPSPPAAKPPPYVTKARLDAVMDAIVDGTASLVVKVHNRGLWRLKAAEGRIADLEARLAQLEGKANGQPVL